MARTGKGLKSQRSMTSATEGTVADGYWPRAVAKSMTVALLTATMPPSKQTLIVAKAT